jgi:hypothetical protein
MFYSFLCSLLSVSAVPLLVYRAFLYFSQDRRGAIKAENPAILNTGVSRILGEMWRSATEEERKPYRDHEAGVREKYKTSIGQWREEQAKKEDEARRLQEEDTKILIEQRRQRQQQEAHTAHGARHSVAWTSAWDKASPPPYNFNTGTSTCESDDLNACFLSRSARSPHFLSLSSHKPPALISKQITTRTTRICRTTLVRELIRHRPKRTDMASHIITSLRPIRRASTHRMITFHHLMYLVLHTINQSLMLEEQSHRIHQERTDNQAFTTRIPMNKECNRTNNLIMRPPKLGLMLEEQSHRRHQERTDNQASTTRIPTNKEGNRKNNLRMRPPKLGRMLEEQSHRIHQERTDKQAFTTRIPTNKEGNRTKNLLMRPPKLGRLGHSNIGIIVGTCTINQRSLSTRFTIRLPAHGPATIKIQRRAIINATQYEQQALNHIRIRAKFLICMAKPHIARMKVLNRSILLVTFLLRDSPIQHIPNNPVIATIQPSVVSTSTDLRGK